VTAGPPRGSDDGEEADPGDLNTMIDRVEPAGGRVTMAKTGDEASGYVAFFTDTEGNTVGLHSPS
jgi:predicted enzyme related to lactoylglutathione lyase